MKNAVILLSALVLVLGTHAVWRADASPAAQAWECKFVRFGGDGGVGDANIAGKDGWELVAVRDTMVEGWPAGLYLKRPVK